MDHPSARKVCQFSNLLDHMIDFHADRHLLKEPLRLTPELPSSDSLHYWQAFERTEDILLQRTGYLNSSTKCAVLHVRTRVKELPFGSFSSYSIQYLCVTVCVCFFLSPGCAVSRSVQASDNQGQARVSLVYLPQLDSLVVHLREFRCQYTLLDIKFGIVESKTSEANTQNQRVSR